MQIEENIWESAENHLPNRSSARGGEILSKKGKG